MNAGAEVTTVLAFGGNALCPNGTKGTYDEQRAHAREMARVVASVVEAGHRAVVTHGNGPQAGHLAIQQETAADLVVAQPLHSVVAMTQGQLGSMVALALREQLPVQVPVLSVATHVRVSHDDPAFHRPTKPIGPFYSEAEAQRLARERGWTVAEVEHGMYRRVVASPVPHSVVELPAIESLLAGGAVVVAAGGGGVPVVSSGDGSLEPVDAVIDKDRAAERLGTAIGAENLVLLTDVSEVVLDFGTPRERPIREMTLSTAMHHLLDGQFPPGSMGPKIDAAVSFLKNGGKLAVITSFRHAISALAGRHGTRIVPDREVT